MNNRKKNERIKEMKKESDRKEINKKKEKSKEMGKWKIGKKANKWNVKRINDRKNEWIKRKGVLKWMNKK